MPIKKINQISTVIRQRAKELRQSQTLAETKLWKVLRNRQLGGFKFRRQHPIDHFIVDFYCRDISLVIEIDGDSHSNQVEYDIARTEWLEDNGNQEIRFSNQDIHRNLDEVIEKILDNCKALTDNK